MFRQSHLDIPEYIFEISILASKDVGKRTFVGNYTTFGGVFDTIKTVGVSFSSKDIELNGKNIRLAIRTHSDEDLYTKFLKFHMSGSVGLILMYDITKLNTLNWLSERFSFIQNIIHNIEYYSILLVGNKLDLGKSREVFKEDVEKFKEKCGLLSSMEVSLKTGENVEKMIIEISNLIIEKLCKY